MTPLSLPRLAQSGDDHELVADLVMRAFSGLMESLPSDSFEAIILTGAMTRGEGSVMHRLDGSRALLSDIDFLIVTKTPKWHRRLRAALPMRAREMNRALRPLGLTSHVDYLTALPEEMRSWPSSISSNEILASGCILAGEGPLSRFFAPGVRPDSIDPHDSLAMIHTRMMGQMLYRADLDSAEQPRFDFALYHCAKVVTDLAAIILSFHRKFTCSCAERLETMRTFIATDPGREIAESIPDLMERLELWTDFKITPDVRRLAERLGIEPTRQSLERAGHEIWEWHRRALRVIWRREIAALRGIEATAPLRDALGALTPSEGLTRAMRGWAKAWLHPATERKRLGMGRTVKGILRRQHPLSLCFASGAALYFGDEFPPDRDSAALASDFSPLPVVNPGDHRAALDDLLWLWLLLVKGGAE